MQQDAEINAILNDEERDAQERALWMAGLPKQVGTLIRVAIAATYTVCAIRWHERNGGLGSSHTTLWEAKTTRDDLVERLRSTLTEGDYKIFTQCMNLIEDMSHDPADCALCTDVPFVFTDKAAWQLLTV